MRKILQWLSLGLLIWAMVFGISILRDKDQLRQQVVRLHVVANSDSAADQAMKLEVRDAVVAYLNEELSAFQSVEQVKSYLRENLHTLEEIADRAVEQRGSEDRVEVTFAEEAFPVRHYDTFSLPAGIYQSLRIRIGRSEGQNWWCVVFPTLCIPQTEQGVQDVAAGSGFSNELSDTLTGEDGYEVRFFLLDWLGRIENMLSDF